MIENPARSNKRSGHPASARARVPAPSLLPPHEVFFFRTYSPRFGERIFFGFDFFLSRRMFTLLSLFALPIPACSNALLLFFKGSREFSDPFDKRLTSWSGRGRPLFPSPRSSSPSAFSRLPFPLLALPFAFFFTFFFQDQFRAHNRGFSHSPCGPPPPPAFLFSCARITDFATFLASPFFQPFLFVRDLRHPRRPASLPSCQNGSRAFWTSARPENSSDAAFFLKSSLAFNGVSPPRANWWLFQQRC